MLKESGFYLRLKASPVYDVYWGIRQPRFVEDRNSELAFYRSLLAGFAPGGLIFDIGANVGDKTDLFIRLGARVLAVEPDQHNQQILRGKFLKYRVAPKPVIIVGQAVSDSAGAETMWVDEPGSALNTLSQKWADALHRDGARIEGRDHGFEFAEKRVVETTTLENLIEKYGFPFFIKVDVEGYEIRVLRGLQRPVPLLSFEVNLPEFRDEGMQCIELLHQLSPEGRFNYSADCRKGLACGEWLAAASFLDAFDRCTEKSVEIFWRNDVKPGSASQARLKMRR